MRAVLVGLAAFVIGYELGRALEPVSARTESVHPSRAALHHTSEAVGDLEYRAPGGWRRLPIGTTGQVLTVSGGVPVWATPA